MTQRADPQVNPASSEHRLTVPRSARYYTLGSIHPGVEELWIVLHGFGQLAARFIRRFEVITHPQRLIVAPEALNRFYIDPRPRQHTVGDVVGATWMTREDREAEIADYVRYLDLLVSAVKADLQAAGGGVAPKRTTLLGFSQGVATAVRWAVQGAHPLHSVILWGGHLPPEVDQEQARRLAVPGGVTLVWGSEEMVANADALRTETELLAGAGVAVERLVFNGGHVVDADTLVRLVGA